MTHVRNVEAFARLVGFCTGYGGKYNPGRPTLRIESLNVQLEEANKALEQVVISKSLYDNEVNRRKQVFDQLPRLAASILRTLEASGAMHEKLDDARFFVHQITGFSGRDRPPIPSSDAQQPAARRPKLQLAYVSRADSFARLVQAVSTEPLYAANEPELSITGIAEKVKELEKLNQQVSRARVAWSNACINRNNALYVQAVSLYRMWKAVKKYLRAIFGPNSEQYAQVKSLKFKNHSNL